MSAAGPFGVLLMTYGSPASLDDVGRYITAVRGGRPPDDELLTEFTRRYRVIGGSPLIRITQDQAEALERRLDGAAVVRTGMRFSPPTIAEGLRSLRDAGATRAVGIILSPQYSPLLMGGYARAIDAARAELGASAPDVRIAPAWHLQPAFVGALADRIREGLAELDSSDDGESGGDARPDGDTTPGSDAAAPDAVPVLLTAHSLPRRVADEEPDYIAQLMDTANAVADAAGLGRERWTFCWQSAGHEPGEWMKPDFADLMPGLRAAGHRSVLVAPIQFLADHLEILYDVDIGAREQAETQGMRFCRIRSLNADPGLVEALAQVALETRAAMA